MSATASDTEEYGAPRGPGEIRALSRPAAILAVVLVRVASGWLLARPLAALFASSGIGQRAEGDAALFADGGLLLLDVLRQRGEDLAALLGGSLPLGLALLGLAQLANAALWVGLNTAGRLRPSAWLRRALSHTPSLIGLGFAGTLLQALLVIAVASGAAALRVDPLHDVTHDLAVAGIALVTLFVLGAISAWSDLAKAARIRHGATFSEAIVGAWLAIGARPWRGLFGYVPYAAAALALLVGAGALTSAIDLSNPSRARLALVTITHQLVIVGLVVLRAGWFASALRLVAGTRGRTST